MAPSACFDTGAAYVSEFQTSIPLTSKNYWADNDVPAETYTPAALQVVITQASDWEYLGEGASNIVYRYKGISPIFSSYLLRLRKSLPGSPSTLTLFNSLQNSFIPALGTDVVCSTVLARLAPGVAQQFNAALARMSWDTRRHGNEGGCSIIGTGNVDEHEEYATLVQDMSCGQWARSNTTLSNMDLRQNDHGSGWMDVAMVEFKPRWLSQSTDAPSDWNVCRSCAVRAMQDRSRDRKKTHHRRCLSGDSGLGMMDDEEEEEQTVEQADEEEEEEEEQYCPLDLTSQDPIRVNRAVRAILHGGAGEVHCSDTDEDLSLAEDLAEVLVNRFTEWLLPGQEGSKIISHLRRAQENWGRHGVFTEDSRAVEEVGKAMAVRDCSVFVRVWARWRYSRNCAPELETKFECRVGDLDVKAGKGGGGVYWRNMERRLVGGGWYGKVCAGSEKSCREF